MIGILCFIGGWVLFSFLVSCLIGTLLYKLGRFDT